ncbi:MAG: hypothetical protein KAY24_10315 [Candidatus Eisenbacteria sp.]|nr:hypothetical protein [Candidatus Eisenbacteria bacterium]
MENQRSKGDKGLNPLQVIGIFWIALGIIMVIAVYAPPTVVGKVANLTAGGILLAIGLIALLKGTRKRASGRAEDI